MNLHFLQWDLICEKSFWRTTVATAVSVGKFLGATTFGILSDKYGRKTCFIIGSIFYIAGSVLTTFSPWYWLFLIGRVLLGSSSSGLFYPAFSLCNFISYSCLLNCDRSINLTVFFSLSIVCLFSDRKYWIKTSFMDEYCVQYVISSWYDFIGNFGKLYSCVETPSTFIDRSILFAGILLLVSKLIHLKCIFGNQSFLLVHLKTECVFNFSLKQFSH